MPARLLVAHRQTLLFLGAVVVPSAVLMALGIRTIRQDEELRLKRRSEERLRIVELARQELLARLEGVRLRATAGQVTPRDRAVGMLARFASGRLMMPWETAVADREADGAFQGALQQAERQLHQLRDPVGASAQARAAALKARTRAQRARADLLLAACLSAQGHQKATRDVVRGLLRLNPQPVDEFGVPYAFYATQRLLEGASSAEQREVLEGLSQALETTWLSPVAAHMAADLSARLGAAGLHEVAAQHASELERLADLPSVLPTLEKAGPQGWISFGKPPWLLGLTGQPGDPDRLLIAVRAQELLAAIRLPVGARWDLGGTTDATPLGEPFSGLRLAILPDPVGNRNGSGRLFFVAALLLVVSVAAFSAWLLNRDVRREARLARLRSQFVSSVSHELRTPISTIRTCAELLDMGRIGDTRQVSEYLRAIIGESDRLSRLVDGVLDFARTEQGERAYHFQSVSLADVIQSAVRELEYQLAQGGFDLRIDADPEVPDVRADPEALAQAVGNLLSNAMKYSGERRQIEVSLRRDGRHAVVRVRDHGIGIAPEEHARIFEGFYRAPLPDGREVPGAGLGLTIVDQIVKAHGGQVTVESQPGQGSTFSLWLPISEQS
ncbi:MAG: HAMP domain-containing histidine kinase [Acidobacteria bacterium]|nr:HAMP domain-containing histidine kinase [Acidobacteriota bacterium]